VSFSVLQKFEYNTNKTNLFIYSYTNEKHFFSWLVSLLCFRRLEALLKLHCIFMAYIFHCLSGRSGAKNRNGSWNGNEKGTRRPTGHRPLKCRKSTASLLGRKARPQPNFHPFSEGAGGDKEPQAWPGPFPVALHH